MVEHCTPGQQQEPIWLFSCCRHLSGASSVVKRIIDPMSVKSKIERDSSHFMLQSLKVKL